MILLVGMNGNRHANILNVPMTQCFIQKTFNLDRMITRAHCSNFFLRETNVILVWFYIFRFEITFMLLTCRMDILLHYVSCLMALKLVWLIIYHLPFCCSGIHVCTRTCNFFFFLGKFENLILHVLAIRPF